MAVYTKSEALQVVRRAYGPRVADSLADRMPDRIDLDDPGDAEMLAGFGLTRDRLFDALGGEL